MTTEPENEAAKEGHNRGGEAGKQLRSFVERVQRLEEEKKAIQDDIKDVKAEAKGNGFDMATFNEMLRLLKMKPHEREEREELRDLYGHNLGIFG